MPSPIVTASLQATGLATISNIAAQLINRYRHGMILALSLPELLRFMLLTLLTAPLNFHWQAYLERTFPARPLPAEVNALDWAERGQKQKPESSTGEKGYYRAEDTEEGEMGAKTEHLEKHDEKHDKFAATTGRDRAPLSWRNTFFKWVTDCITIGAFCNTVGFLIIMGIMKGKSMAQIAATVHADTIPIILVSYKLWPLASVISFTMVSVEKRIVFLSLVGVCWGVYMSMVASVV